MVFTFGQAVAGEGNSQLMRQLELGDSQKIVTYGTSLTANSAWPAGLQATLHERFHHQAKIVNSAGGGKDSRWGVANLSSRVLKEKPDAVFIEFAINDALAGSKLSLKESAANLGQMIRLIRERRPQCEVIVMVMNPPTGEALEKRPNIRRYEEIYREVAKKESCRLIDFAPEWQRIITREPKRWRRYAPDGLHPTPQACDEVILPSLLKKLGIAHESPSSHKVS